MSGLVRAVINRFSPSDEEYIERVRRGVALYDRYGRPIIVGMSVLLTTIYTVVFLLVVWFLMGGMAPVFGFNPWETIPGFVLGSLTGGWLAVIFFRLLHEIAFAIDLNRNHRLLVRLHDALQERSREVEYDSEGYADDEPTE
jgi:hypothetical protein